MRTILKCLILTFVIASCNSNKGYEVDIDSYNQTVHITIPPPKVGVSGMGRVDWKIDLDIIEKDIFDELKKSTNKGIFTMNLSLIVKDQYGNTQFKEIGKIGEINADEVKKYVDYSYFKGHISKLISDGYFNNLKVITVGSNSDNNKKKEGGESLSNTTISKDDYIVKQIRRATYLSYYNSRFDYSIAYPSFLYIKEESDNGDGCKLSLNSDIYLSVAGINNVLNESIESQFYKNDIDSYVYSKLGNNWFVISDYTIDGRIFYQKTSLHNGAFITAILYFPAEYKKDFDGIIKRIFSRFPN